MWNASQYLQFGNERTQPCYDLVNRIQLETVSRVIDLGCGPGNSTQVLRGRWPEAQIRGLDSSTEMIDKARDGAPDQAWALGDIEDWAADSEERYDIVFANAALHWVRNHDVLLPRLLSRTDGVVAAQMPAQKGEAHRLMQSLSLSSRWRRSFHRLPQWHGLALEEYFDLLAPLTARLDLWSTEYIHVMANADAIVDWYRATGLRAYLDELSSQDERERFVADYTEGIREIYKPQPGGKVLFPFRRLFLIAYK